MFLLTKDARVTHKKVIYCEEGLIRNELVWGTTKIDVAIVYAPSTPLKRVDFFNSMKNKTVDFLLEYIPAMSIPDFHGVSNDIEYDITDLDLTEFKLDRKNVQVTLLDDFLRVRQREQFLAVKASGVGANFKGIGWKYLQQYFPYLRGEGRADAKVRTGGAFLLLFFL